jgi:hypothetical protein
MKTDSADYKNGQQNYKGDFQFVGEYQKFLFSFMLLWRRANNENNTNYFFLISEYYNIIKFIWQH